MPEPEPEPINPEPRSIVIGDSSLGSPVVAYGEQDIEFFKNQKAHEANESLWKRDFGEHILPPYPIPIPERLQGTLGLQKAMMVYTSETERLLSLDDGSDISERDI